MREIVSGNDWLSGGSAVGGFLLVSLCLYVWPIRQGES